MIFLKAVERYLLATGISPSRFGREAVGDPRFVHDLRHGRVPRDSMIRRVYAFMGNQREAR